MRPIPMRVPLAVASAVALVAMSAVAQSTRDTPPWRTAYHDDVVTVKIDTAKTRKNADGFYRAHLRWEYAANQTIAQGHSYRTMVEDRLVDCKNVQTKSLNASAYDANEKVVSSFTTPADEIQYLNWSRRKAGSTSDKAFTAVCKSLTRGKATVAKKPATGAKKK